MVQARESSSDWRSVQALRYATNWGVVAAPPDKFLKLCLSQVQFWECFDAIVTYFLFNDDLCSVFTVLSVSGMVKQIHYIADLLL